jgi:transposase-like protein
MRLINYVRVKNNVKAAHIHPLTPISATPQKQKVAGPSVLFVESTSSYKCSACRKAFNARTGGTPNSRLRYEISEEAYF